MAVDGIALDKRTSGRSWPVGADLRVGRTPAGAPAAGAAGVVDPAGELLAAGGDVGVDVAGALAADDVAGAGAVDAAAEDGVDEWLADADGWVADADG